MLQVTKARAGERVLARLDRVRRLPPAPAFLRYRPQRGSVLIPSASEARDSRLTARLLSQPSHQGNQPCLLPCPAPVAKPPTLRRRSRRWWNRSGRWSGTTGRGGGG